MKQRAIIFDRDGVLNPVVLKNGKPHPPAKDLYHLYPFAEEEIKKLRSTDFSLFIFTNQPDVTSGILSFEELTAQHQKFLSPLGFELEHIAICCHLDSHHCLCRKPKPGMLHDLAQKYDLDLSHSFVVGDRWRDIEAGQNAGCKTILIGEGYNEKSITPDFQCEDLRGVYPIIITHGATLC